MNETRSLGAVTVVSAVGESASHFTDLLLRQPLNPIRSIELAVLSNAAAPPTECRGSAAVCGGLACGGLACGETEVRANLTESKL